MILLFSKYFCLKNIESPKLNFLKHNLTIKLAISVIYFFNIYIYVVGKISYELFE